MKAPTKLRTGAGIGRADLLAWLREERHGALDKLAIAREDEVVRNLQGRVQVLAELIRELGG